MKLLIADDDATTSVLLKHWGARWGYEVISVGDGLAALTALQEDSSIRLCVFDWLMPGLTGPELCQQVRALPEGEYRYMILLTAKTGVADVVKGIEAGADDYLVKPCDPNELDVRLRSGSRVIQLQERLLATQAELRRRASHDTLTGLFNRGAICEHLVRELERETRSGEGLAVVICDMDHFKSVNDNFGHHAGDAVLVEATRRILRSLRQYDRAGRYGGEEFLVVLPGCGAESAYRVVERLRITIALNRFSTDQGDLGLTCSFGIATTREFPGLNTHELLRRADSALYRAKDAGRNRAVVASKELDETQLSVILSEPLEAPSRTSGSLIPNSSGSAA